MLGFKSGTLVLVLIVFIGGVYCNDVFPIIMKDFDTVNFKNLQLFQNILYRKKIEPKHALELTFSNINLGTVQLQVREDRFSDLKFETHTLDLHWQVFTQYNESYKTERFITGTPGESIKVTLHSTEYGGVFVPKITGTFTLVYSYTEKCDHYCAVDAVTKEPLFPCGTLPDEEHQVACLQCKEIDCFHVSVSPNKIPERQLFGVTYCPLTLVSRRFGCSKGREVGSTCSFSCDEGFLPGDPDVKLIESTCKLVSEGVGEWEGFPENFCLTQDRFIELCLSTDSDLAACQYDIDSMTESFGEEPPTTTETTTTTTTQRPRVSDDKE